MVGSRFCRCADQYMSACCLYTGNVHSCVCYISCYTKVYMNYLRAHPAEQAGHIFKTVLRAIFSVQGFALRQLQIHASWRVIQFGLVVENTV